MEQAELCVALAERRSFLPELAERVLFPDESIAGKPY